jgi:hypothetical protein
MTQHTEEEIKRMFADMGLESEDDRDEFRRLAGLQEEHEQPTEQFVMRPQMTSEAPEESSHA